LRPLHIPKFSRGSNGFNREKISPWYTLTIAVEMSEEEVGRISNYFSHLSVAAIEITNGAIKVGDSIRIKGVKTDFVQKLESMEIDRQPVERAEKGSSVGIKVKEKVRPNDVIFKVL